MILEVLAQAQLVTVSVPSPVFPRVGITVPGVLARCFITVFPRILVVEKSTEAHRVFWVGLSSPVIGVKHRTCGSATVIRERPQYAAAALHRNTSKCWWYSPREDIFPSNMIPHLNSGAPFGHHHEA